MSSVILLIAVELADSLTDRLSKIASTSAKPEDPVARASTSSAPPTGQQAPSQSTSTSTPAPDIIASPSLPRDSLLLNRRSSEVDIPALTSSILSQYGQRHYAKVVFVPFVAKSAKEAAEEEVEEEDSADVEMAEVVPGELLSRCLPDRS